MFKITPDGTETVLHAFEGPDGIGLSAPICSWTARGNIYGVSYAGGAFNTCYGGPGCGTVFKIASDGAFTSLYSFKGINSGGNDGNFPLSTLIEDDAGNLYGTTWSGGAYLARSCKRLRDDLRDRSGRSGDGAVYLSRRRRRTGARRRRGSRCAGQSVRNGLCGGDLHCQKHVGCGIAYKLAPNGTFTIIHVFEKTDGVYPVGGLTGDGAGNLYGTTTAGRRLRRGNRVRDHAVSGQIA